MMVVNFGEYVKENAWTWAGAVYLLLTLSGATFVQAALVTLITIAVHGFLTMKGDDDEQGG